MPKSYIILRRTFCWERGALRLKWQSWERDTQFLYTKICSSADVSVRPLLCLFPPLTWHLRPTHLSRCHDHHKRWWPSSSQGVFAIGLPSVWWPLHQCRFNDVPVLSTLRVRVRSIRLHDSAICSTIHPRGGTSLLLLVACPQPNYLGFGCNFGL